MSNDPTSPPTVEARGASYRSDELVVALGYDALVEKQLKDWGADPVFDDTTNGEPNVDYRLGLRRVPLNACRAVEHLDKVQVQKARDEAEEEGYTSSYIDVLIRNLRYAFKARFNGWAPGIGKNRIMSRPRGSYVIQGGAGEAGLVLKPDYVFDGGSTARAASTVVQRRDRKPGTGVIVGVVDTPLSANPWLAGGYLTSADAILSRQLSRSIEIEPSEDHSTFVVGMILRQAPGATILLLPALQQDASADSWTVARAIADLAAYSPAVVNLSMGCLTDDNQAPMVLTAALNALGPDTLVVAAAGNHGSAGDTPRPAWPAAMDSVIAVGALDEQNARAGFSPNAQWIDAVAPGVDVISTITPRQNSSGDDVLFGAWEGTSFAAAAVTGQIVAGVDPRTTPQESWETLKKNAQKRKTTDADGRPMISLTPLGTPPRRPNSASLAL